MEKEKYENFVEELKKRNVTIVACANMDKVEEVAKVVEIIEKNSLKADEFLYPEGGVEEISYDKANKNFVKSNFNFIFVFKQKDSDGDEYIWCSVYKDLNNLEKELRLIDLEMEF